MSAESLVYADSSALVKLVDEELESAALRTHLGATPRVASSALARVEVLRAARTYGSTAIERAQRVLRTLELVPLTDTVLDAAAALDDAVLRSLDAIHVASAMLLRQELSEIITYDRRMAAAAAAHGLTVAAPR